jgi:hypothetical protein
MGDFLVSASGTRSLGSYPRVPYFILQLQTHTRALHTKLTQVTIATSGNSTPPTRFGDTVRKRLVAALKVPVLKARPWELGPHAKQFRFTFPGHTLASRFTRWKLAKWTTKSSAAAEICDNPLAPPPTLKRRPRGSLLADNRRRLGAVKRNVLREVRLVRLL